jgi:hypothetical protein
MPGKAYMADIVKRDMARLTELLDEMSSDYECGNPLKEYFEKIRKIVESYEKPDRTVEYNYGLDED